jgi:phage shock protein A
MNIFSRLFKIGQSEAHSAINNLENPIKLTEQGIRDMKVDLDKSLHALAEVKAMAIRTKNDRRNYEDQTRDYEQKAVLLLKKAQSGELDANEADRLATEALNKKEQTASHVTRLTQEHKKYETSIQQLEVNINKLKSNISQWENELRTLKARMKVSTATKNINKQMANIDSSSTVAMLERMKEKVAVEESLAESYGQIANESKTLDEEIDKALDTKPGQSSEKLAELKKKLGMQQEGGQAGGQPAGES